MAEVVAGGKEELKNSPFIALYTEPISPLTLAKESTQKLMYMAEKSLPVVFTPCVITGATGPVTIAGGLVQANAEILAGYVLANLIKEGTPFIYGGGVMAMDMSTSVACYASTSSNSVSVNSPCGSRNFPVGPMLPATYFPSGLTSLAILAACRLSS